jgi:DNA-directed RNA polymerase subunit RPC12/RpoP
MMSRVKCLRCGGILIETVESLSWDRKGRPTKPQPKTCEIELEGDEAFYRCPHCRARNLLTETRGETGFPRLVIIGISD